MCSRVRFINFRFILYLYKRTLQFGQQIGKQISSRRSRAGGLNPRRVQFNWKKVNSARRYQRAIKKDRTSARAERCVISQRRTQYGEHDSYMSPRAARYRFYNQGRGSEPRVPVSSPAKPSLTRSLYMSLVQLVTSLELFAVYINILNDRKILSTDVCVKEICLSSSSSKKRSVINIDSFLYEKAVSCSAITIIGILSSSHLEI